jgi:hypothetical protein
MIEKKRNAIEHLADDELIQMQQLHQMIEKMAK